MKKRLTVLKVVGLTLVGVMVSGSAMANKHHEGHELTRTESHGGFKLYHPEDDSYWFAINGRLNFDEVQFSGNANAKGPHFPSGANIRRAYLGLTGGLGHALSYNLTLDFSGANGSYSGNGTTVDFIDAYFNLAGEPMGWMGASNLRFGQFSAPSTIDFWGSTGINNDTMFLEPALATTAFAVPDKVYGVWADATGMDMFMLSASVYQPRQNNSTTAPSSVSTGTPGSNYGNTGGADKLGAGLRLTFSPVHTDDTVYHVGIASRYQSTSHRSNASGQVFQPNLFQTGPELRARNTGMLVSTGNVLAKSYNTVSAEALGIWGPVTVEAEVTQATVQRVSTLGSKTLAGNPRFQGWHFEGGYMLTGESRRYDFATGTLHNPKPEARCGAWEIAARYSFVNLVDAGKGIYGGSEHNMTVGLNWFVNQNVKVALNYVHANIRPTAGVGTTVVPSITTPGIDVKRVISAVGLRVGVMF